MAGQTKNNNQEIIGIFLEKRITNVEVHANKLCLKLSDGNFVEIESTGPIKIKAEVKQIKSFMI